MFGSGKNISKLEPSKEVAEQVSKNNIDEVVRFFSKPESQIDLGKVVNEKVLGFVESLDPVRKVIANFDSKIFEKKLRKELKDANVKDVDAAIVSFNNKLRELKASFHKINESVASKNIGETLSEVKNYNEFANSLGAGLSNNINLREFFNNMNLSSAPLKQIINEIENIAQLKSKNLGNDAKFVEEVLLAKQNKDYFAKWLSNKENKEKYDDLVANSSRVSKIVENLSEKGRTKIPIGTRAVGLTGADKLTNTILALTGSGAGLLGMLGVFSDNKTQEAANEIPKTKQLTSSLNVTGEGKVIVDDVNQSLEKIYQVANESEQTMKEDPEKAIKTYVEGVGREVKNISTNLSKWDVVIRNAEDKQQAITMGKQIQNNINQFSEVLSKLGSTVGVASHKFEDFVKGNDNEIYKIQDLINDFYPEVMATGTIDKKTISALKKLEQRFNARTKSDGFTNKFFYNGEIISYEDLLKAFEILRKY